MDCQLHDGVRVTVRSSARDRLVLVAKCLGIIACLYLFIVGIGGMGEAVKLFGRGFSEQVLKTTASPFVGLFIGILATSIVQSSSTTTSIIVGMVAAGAISIEGAIPMVMGANIGTTITNTIVSLGHLTRAAELKRAFAAATIHDFFNVLTVVALLPLELLTGVLSRSARALEGLFHGMGGMTLANPLQIATKPVLAFLSGLLKNYPILLLAVSVVLIFAMLACLVKLLRSLVLKKVESFFDKTLFKNAASAMLLGLLLTATVQSSSVTTSLIIPLAGAGILRLIQIFPYTMGANVGTTVTAILAAMATGRSAAVTVSFAHLLFNIFGILLIWPVPWIRQIPIRLAEGLAELSVRNRLMALVYIGLVFFAIPLALIAIFK